MNKVGSRQSFVFFLAVIVGSFVIYFGFGERTNSAQEKKIEQPKAKFADFSKADAVTSDIRNSRKEIVRVELRSIDDRDKALKLGTVVQDFGGSLVIAKNKSANLAKSGLDARKIETRINLPGAKFEPVEQPPIETVKPGAEAARPSRGYYVVQLGGIATDDWLDSLRDAGVEVIQYIPNQAFFIYGEGNAIVNAATHSRVRWVGRYLPEHKKSPELANFVGNIKGDTAMFDVAVFSRADLHDARIQVSSAMRGKVLNEIAIPNNFFNVIRIEASPADLDAIARIEDVVRIDQYEKPRIEDERAAQIVAGNFSSTTVLSPPGYNPLTQFGVNGQNVTVSMVDDGVSIPGNGGFYLTAANTVNGPLRGALAGATGGHGHLNASIIAGDAPFSGLDPTGYNYGVGVAPKSNIINIPLVPPATYTGTEADAYNDTVVTPGPNGVLGSISNNSWGAGLNSNAYDSYAAQFDGFVRDASAGASIDPICLVFSAGNAGPGALSLTRPKAAKNLIAVGNSENIRTELGGANADNIDDLRSSSSRGPTADGRIKPDITAPGTFITGGGAWDGVSLLSVSGFIDVPARTIAYSTGTSHAAPQVAGAAALFTQYWKSSHGGEYPRPSLIKAAIINSGQEMNGATTNLLTIPNGNEGWGRMNMKFMMNSGVSTLYLNESHTFDSPGTLVGFLGAVADPSKPIRISLVWTDPPATADPALVNDLDLTVNVGGNIYRGNVFTSGVSTTGGAADSKNNVENVFLPAGTPAGTFVSISVKAVALNGDGVLGNADLTDQHYSLVAYNVQTPNVGARPPVDFDGDRKTDVSIFRGNMQQWWIYLSQTASVYATGWGAGLETATPVPADYTGDGKADIAVMGNLGTWYVLRSENATYYTFPFGTTGDVPVVGDFDGDAKSDPTVFRNGTWYINRSSGGTDILAFGQAGDRPVVGDFDGDGVSDIGIFRPADGQWWIRRSTLGVIVYQFGVSTDRLVPGDYTGDGKTDVALWRPSTGEWFVLRSEDLSYYSGPFGANGDLPVPGDYDGDGKFDTAVFRPATGTWFINRSAAGIHVQNFGANGDIPLPNTFVR